MTPGIDNMLQLKEINTGHPHYPFVETLLQTAFPETERRDTPQQREHADEHPLFHNNLIVDNGMPVGLLTYWNFGTFLYIEHFAIDSNLRNNGYGQRALAMLKEQAGAPIVLEAEEPTDELTHRRIGFYQRQGFVLQDFNYRQPPYRSGDEWLPMRLMTFGEVDLASAQATIYREVYGAVEP